MTGEIQRLDLTSPLFWAVVAAAVMLMTPIVDLRLRQWIWAIVNCGAILVLLGPAELVGAVVLVVLVHATARSLGRAGSARPVFPCALLGVVALMLIHKLDPPQWAWPAGLKPVLVALAFSYVALRAVELLRAVHEKRHVSPTLHSTLNYLVPFHMLAAGPIQAFDAFATQPVPAPASRRDTIMALERIAQGLFKKFVIAQLLASIFLTGFSAHPAYLLLEVQVFYIWVYLDFSAYTDIAVGIGRLMGVDTPENFDRPLSARNITVFWERWHMSLSLFIRRNLFTPLQLALVRRSPRRSALLSASIALSISFVLCGLWHNVSTRYLIWGAAHALGLVSCNVYRHLLRRRVGRAGVNRYMQNQPLRWLATAVTFEFVAFSIAFALYPGTYSWE